MNANAIGYDTFFVVNGYVRYIIIPFCHITETAGLFEKKKRFFRTSDRSQLIIAIETGQECWSIPLSDALLSFAAKAALSRSSWQQQREIETTQTFLHS